jgi:tetratricopeptide (TPR) repeat protein
MKSFTLAAFEKKKTSPVRNAASAFTFVADDKVDGEIIEKNINTDRPFESNELNFDYFKDKGVQLAENGEMGKAISCFNEALRYEPENAIVHEMKAQAYMSEDMYLEAIKSAESAIFYHPEWAEGWLTLARSQRNFGEVELSASSFKKALEFDATNAEILSEFREMESVLQQYESLRKFHMKEVHTIISTETNTLAEYMEDHIPHGDVDNNLPKIGSYLAEAPESERDEAYRCIYNLSSRATNLPRIDQS